MGKKNNVAEMLDEKYYVQGSNLVQLILITKENQASTNLCILMMLRFQSRNVGKQIATVCRVGFILRNNLYHGLS